jgi:xylulose-5-phosphate/fructose-6-phosphate phosphoketolase
VSPCGPSTSGGACHRLTYRRTNHDNIHVRSYKEKGNINTPMELAIQNQVDRFTLAMDAIDRVPSLKLRGSHARDALMNRQIDCRHHAHQEGSTCRRSSTGNGRSSRPLTGR